MLLRRLASSVLALSFLGGLATAHPYRYEDDLAGSDPVLVTGHFAKPPIDAVDPDAPVLSRAQIKSALAARRAQNLALFRAYRTGGMYPHNFVTDSKLNVWLDDEGHLCAAATIIKNSGNLDLAMSVPDTNNFLRLADVTDGALMDWILTSGFTQDEIAAIQEPFMGKMEPIRIQEPDQQRMAEDARLAKRYAQVERQLIKARNKSLERAVDRMMEHPELWSGLVASV